MVVYPWLCAASARTGDDGIVLGTAVREQETETPARFRLLVKIEMSSRRGIEEQTTCKLKLG